jgi:hypothetical protein
VRKYKGVPPYKDTRLFVKKVLANYYELKRAAKQIRSDVTAQGK